MSSIITRSATTPPARRVVLAGRILVFLGSLHLVATAVASAKHLPRLLSGAGWMDPADLAAIQDLTPTIGAFWLFWGSFGVPLVALGALVAWLGRNGTVPPLFVAVIVAGWGLVSAAVLEPSPFVAVLIPTAMLLSAHRAARRTP